MQVGLQTPITDPPSWWMLACCLCFVWCVALFTVKWPFNCHCKNALTQLWCNGCIVMNLKGNANYFKDSQMFLSLTVNGNSCTQFLVNVRNHGVWTLFWFSFFLNCFMNFNFNFKYCDEDSSTNNIGAASFFSLSDGFGCFLNPLLSLYFSCSADIHTEESVTRPGKHLRPSLSIISSYCSRHYWILISLKILTIHSESSD